MRAKDINIMSIDQTNMGQLETISKEYAKAFADPNTWDEVSKCPTSETKRLYGIKFPVGTPCPDCKEPLSEAYPKDETIKYILEELGNANPIGLLAYVKNELTGFSWGYQTSIENITKKWDTDNMQNLVKSLLKQYGVNNQFFYGSETVAVKKGQGVGKELIKTRLNMILSTGENFVLVRTSVKSPMYGICSSIDGFTQILGPTSNKLPFSKKWKISKKFINAKDSENPNRVLFLYDEQSRQERAKQRDYYGIGGPGWYQMH